MTLSALSTALAILLALDLLFAALRASLVQARLPHLVDLREKNPRAVDRTLNLLERPTLRATLRLELVIVHFMLALVAWQVLISLVKWPFSLALLLGAMLLASLLVMALEFALEGLVLKNIEGWALRLSGLAQLTDLLFRPFALLYLSLLGNPEGTRRSLGSVTEDELKSWVEDDQNDGGLEEGERKMIYSIFQFGDTLVREVMVPRIDVFALDVNTSLPDAIEAVLASGHSRMPVYDDSIDNLLGLIYAKDMLRALRDPQSAVNIRDFLRPAYYVPEAKKVDELLREMQDRGMHMAVVVDEYGGMAGLVTLEDIVEEIVGEIRDEFDESEEDLYVQVSPDEFVFQGRVDLGTVNELLNTHLSREVADTLGGYIYGEIGRVPVGGEQIAVDGWELTVEQVSRRRIGKVRAARHKTQPQEEEKSNDDKR